MTLTRARVSLHIAVRLHGGPRPILEGDDHGVSIGRHEQHSDAQPLHSMPPPLNAATTRTTVTPPTPDILLLQARQPGDPILDHELDCFARRCHLDRQAFSAVNMVQTCPDSGWLDGPGAVMVGGAGQYSVVQGGFDWHEPLLKLLRAVVARRMPMFASCFGFQALVQAFGGRVEADETMAEVGTHRIRLTARGRRDGLLADYPDEFDAQFGHNDSVTQLPDSFVLLASSKRCRHQAIRWADAPIVATQFHPELNARDNTRRYMTYLQNYAEHGLSRAEARHKADQIHRDSPQANQLLATFVRQALRADFVVA